MQLTTEKDIAIIYASLGLIGSLLGAAYTGEKVEEDQITKLMQVLNLVVQRAEQLDKELEVAVAQVV